MKNLLKIAEPDEALCRENMFSLGYPKNRVRFPELALLLPWKEIRKLRDGDKIEKALLCHAGFIRDTREFPKCFDLSLRMDRSVWDFRGTIPVNRPDRRIKWISYLLDEATDFSLVDHFIVRIKAKSCSVETPRSAKMCVRQIMAFRGIGEQRKIEVLFNITLPFVPALRESRDGPRPSEFLNRILSSHRPLPENRVIKLFRKSLPDKTIYSGLNFSAKTYFGILYFVKSEKNYRILGGIHRNVDFSAFSR